MSHLAEPIASILAGPLAGLQIRTEFVNPPIGIRCHDWQAWIDGQEESGIVGSGETEAEAVAMLLEMLEDQES